VGDHVDHLMRRVEAGPAHGVVDGGRHGLCRQLRDVDIG